MQTYISLSPSPSLCLCNLGNENATSMNSIDAQFTYSLYIDISYIILKIWLKANLAEHFDEITVESCGKIK